MNGTASWIVAALAVVGAAALLSALAAAVVLGVRKRIPRRAVLSIDFEQGLVEHVPDDTAARMALARRVVVRDVVEALERAAVDGRVRALFARIGGRMGLAQVQEVRDAVARFRAGGKPAIAYAETFGERGPGNAAYYLATAFSEIYMMPSGDLNLTGLMARTSFLRGTLDKLGVIPRVDHRREYKSLRDILVERRYTEPHREAVQKVLDSWLGQIVAGIADARRLPESEVRTLVDRGPFLGKEAVEAGLVDGLAYRDEALGKAKGRAGRDAAVLAFARYRDRAVRPHRRGTAIAMLHGVGMIQRGRSRFNPFSGAFRLGADTVAEAFRAAVRDKKVKAILLRIDSGGWSYVASDAVWRETVRAREAGKPVIVTMGNLAGSGAYMIAAAAHRIVAHPATLTGSIGVVGGKLVVAGLFERAGVTWDEVRAGENADMWTQTKDYTPAQWEKLQDMLDRIYDDFTARVARGRNLPMERVLEIAKGRVWTGEDARALGLVDELGGFPAALRLAREAAGIPAEAPVRLKAFPPPKPSWRRIVAGRPPAGAVEAALDEALAALRPLAPLSGAFGQDFRDGPLTMPEWTREDPS
jgi:protease IV